MPGISESTGYSLWLVPPEDSELYKAIHSLILTSIPSLFPIAIPPKFTPHVSLTTDIISPNVVFSKPQEWLDELQLGSLSKLKLIFGEAKVRESFFEKVVLACDQAPEMLELAAQCRIVATGEPAGAQAWVKRNYRPHFSLLYSDLPQDEVRSKLKEVKLKVQEAALVDKAALKAQGGSIWLVSTFKDLEEWQPVARKEMPDIKWRWAT